MSDIDTYYLGPNGLPTIGKGPAEELPYSWDFEDLLTAETGLIAEVVAITLSEGLEQTGIEGHDTKHVTATLKGGAVDQLLRASCRIKTTLNFTFERAIELQIVPR